MVLFRQHRGSLDEAMKTVQEVNSLQDIVDICNEPKIGPEILLEDVSIKYYCEDERINWNTYIVTAESHTKNVQFGVLGFTNGPLT